MKNNKNYCINCMKEIHIEEEICPYCGCKAGEYTMNQRALKPLTILHGKYLVGKVLGEGGFGITYLGVDLTLNLKVAIKEFFPTQFASRNVYESGSNDIVVINGKSAANFQRKLERYEAEARRLVKLESLPGVVRVINFFYENNTAYMVMEFISGQNLKDYKEKNRSKIHWKEALDIMKPIIRSLSVLHEKDIIHRDISPDNIMITDQNELVLIDFGTAVEIDDDERSKEIELKRGYAPPEQYSSHGDQGPWTDVYELCATLYYMISGNTLPDALAVYRKDAKVVPLRDSDHTIPAEVEVAIMKGLNTDIKYRIKNMDELYGHLYDGCRIIPWRKIGLGSVIAASIIALMLIMIGVKSIYFNNDVEDSNGNLVENSQQKQDLEMQTQQPEMTNKETETDANEEDGNVNDTAFNYVKENGLAYVEDSLITYTENDYGITVTGSDNSLADIVIPEEVNGKPVTSISGIGRNVTSIVLPDTLASIENSAFRNCVYLESIYIPAGVTSIGENAFENCMSLSEIHISNSNSIFHVENGSIIDADGNKHN